MTMDELGRKQQSTSAPPPSSPHSLMTINGHVLPMSITAFDNETTGEFVKYFIDGVHATLIEILLVSQKLLGITDDLLELGGFGFKRRRFDPPNWYTFQLCNLSPQLSAVLIPGLSTLGPFFTQNRGGTPRPRV